MKGRCAALALVLALAAGPIPGRAQGPHDLAVAPLRVEAAWARPTPGPVRTGAVYMEIVNEGDEADRLMRAETPVAERAELHTSLKEGDIVRMRRLEAVEIGPRRRVLFAPGGPHVMLFGLARPLVAGERFPLTLVFAKAGRVKVQVSVGRLPPGAREGLP